MPFRSKGAPVAAPFERKGTNRGPWLIVLGGLPGVGKTTLSRALATRVPMVHLRVDTIEQALVDSGELPGPVQVGGYAVAYRVAEDQLALGQSVIADMVNPVDEVRAAWLRVADRHQARVLQIDLTCSDGTEHRRRVTTRRSDIATLQQPTWEQVHNRVIEPWRPDLRLDTAYETPAQLADRVLAAMTTPGEG
nr:AAA family ATPase [Leekyejoonella antrihumi]